MTLLQKITKILSQNRAVVWLIVALGALIYINSLPNEMFWDDDDFILNNRYIQDWRFWPHFFTDNILSGTHLLSNYWRPLLQFVFAIEWHLWGSWGVYGWHAVNTAFHIADAALLFYLLLLIFENRWLALLTSLIFLVHPVQNEAVVYVNSLGDSLSTFFVLSGLLFFVRFRKSQTPMLKSRDWWLALAMYPLALMSKETGILLVAYIFLCDYILQQGTLIKGHIPLLQRLQITMKNAWIFILIAVIYMVLRATVLNFNNSFNFYDEATPFTSHLHLRIFTFFRVLAIYCGLLFIPYDIRVERLIETPQSLFIPDVLWGATIFTGLVLLAVRFWKSKPIITFGILWFFAGILPTSNLVVIINALVYEHWLYLPLVGIFLIVFSAGLSVAKHLPQSKSALIAVVILFLAALSIRTAWRNTDWRTAIGFYEKLIMTAPNSYRVINNLGLEYSEKGLHKKAEPTYKKAIALDPKNAVAYHNIAGTYRDTGRTALAIENFEKAIALQNDFIFSYKSLAQLYLKKQEYQKARLLLERYFNFTEEKPYTLQVLTQIAFAQKDYPGAQRYLSVALKMNPDNAEAKAALAKIEELLSTRGRGSEARGQ